MVLGLRAPDGPAARSSDLIGLDTLLAVSESLYEEFRDPRSVAPALLNRMVEAGLLGRKSGRGFYDYSKLATASRRIDEWRATTCHCRRGAPRRRSAGTRSTG